MCSLIYHPHHYHPRFRRGIRSSLIFLCSGSRTIIYVYLSLTIVSLSCFFTPLQMPHSHRNTNLLLICQIVYLFILHIKHILHVLLLFSTSASTNEHASIYFDGIPTYSQYMYISFGPCTVTLHPRNINVILSSQPAVVIAVITLRNVSELSSIPRQFCT